MDNGIQLLISRTMFPREPVQICRYKGLEFVTDLSAGDANGARQVLATDEYRRFLGQMSLEGPLNVLDIGANNGGFTLLLASEGFDLQNAVCVELNPHTFSRLRFNLERNFGPEVRAMNVAVCGEHRDVTIPDTRGGTADSIYDGDAGSAEGRTVTGMTFDEVMSESFGSSRVDICKMDIEGAEFETIAGNNCERLSDCRYLLIEIHHFPDRPRETVVGRLEEMGFRQIGGEGISDDHHYVHLFENSQKTASRGTEQQAG